MKIDEIEGTVTNVEETGEPWEFHETATTKEVTGWLRDRVLRKTGLAGRVTSVEVDRTDGTCEICGSESEEIKLYVGGELVYSEYDEVGMDQGESPNPFLKLNTWLESM